MIPTNRATGKPARAQGTDSCTIRCDTCSQESYVSASSVTPAEIRTTAEKTGWSTTTEGKKTLDHCPECTWRAGRRRLV